MLNRCIELLKNDWNVELQNVPSEGVTCNSRLGQIIKNGKIYMVECYYNLQTGTIYTLAAIRVENGEMRVVEMIKDKMPIVDCWEQPEMIIRQPIGNN